MAARPVNPIHWLSGRTAPALSRPPGRRSLTGGKERQGYGCSAGHPDRGPARESDIQTSASVGAARRPRQPAPPPTDLRQHLVGRSGAGAGGAATHALISPPDDTRLRRSPLAVPSLPMAKRTPLRDARTAGLRRPAASHLPRRRRRAGLPHVEPRQRRRPRPAGPPPRFLRRAVLTRSAAAADTGRRRVRGGF